MDRTDLIEIQKDAARALEAGAKLAERVSSRRYRIDAPDKASSPMLGALLANPGAFWAGATAVEADGDGDTVRPLALALKYAGSRLAAGDYTFVRESLLGQSQWLGVIAVNMLRRAETEKVPDRAISFVKLALAAQRQAATTIATAAALNKLEASSVAMVDEGGRL